MRASEEFSCGFNLGQNVKGLTLEEHFSVKTNFVENVSCVWGRVLSSSSSLLGKSSGLPQTQQELSCACPGCAGIQGVLPDPIPRKGRGIAGAATPGLAGPWAPAASRGQQHSPGLSTPVSLGVHQSWELHPPLMETSSSNDSLFTRLDLCASSISHTFSRRMCLQETIIIPEQLGA